MIWKNEVFKNFKLYAVTDVKREDPALLDKVSAAYAGGADIVQLRSKTLSDSALLRLGQRMRMLADKYQKLFFVNDRVDLALAMDADGVHLGQDDLPVAFARNLAIKSSKTLWIGKSTHSLEQAKNAAQERPDYIGVGPIFGTPTKPTYKPVGLSLIHEVKSSVSLPFVCIGGINLDNLNQVLDAGASRVAVVRALFDAKDTENVANEFADQITNHGTEIISS